MSSLDFDIWTRVLLVSYRTLALWVAVLLASLSRLQDRPLLVFRGSRCYDVVPTDAASERGAKPTSSLPTRGAATAPRVHQGPPRRARSRTQDGQARHHFGSVRLDVHAE